MTASGFSDLGRLGGMVVRDGDGGASRGEHKQRLVIRALPAL